MKMSFLIKMIYWYLLTQKKKDINKKIKKRVNFNVKLINMFRKIQLKPSFKKTKSHYIIKNTFTKNPVKKQIKKILSEII